MGNGNRSVVVDGTEKAKESSKQCDVGLGLRTQSTEPFPSTGIRMMMPHYSQSMGVVGAGVDGGGAGGSIYCTLSNQVPCFTDSYDVFGSSSSSFKSSGGDMAAAAAKVTFTETQWQELVRQTTIYKYMMASLPVPPQLLIPTPKSPSPLTSAPQLSGFSRNSDPEPWRCRRTDGKKWRCTRDVAPNQKYCERHCHKTKPRSRKPVELPSQSHNNTHSHTTTTTTTNNTSKTNITDNNNLNTHSLANTAAQKPTFQIPTMVSGPTYAQPRCTEWLMKGDSVPGSTLDQQWQQQLIQSSSREGLKRYNEENYRNWSVFQQHYDEQQPINTNLNSYFDLDDSQRSKNHQQRKMACLQGGFNTDQTQTTRRFIDAWSSEEREAMDGISSKYSVSSKGKLPLSSGLSLSMSRDDGIDEESRNAHLGLGMMDPESERGGGCFKSQWLDPVSWMGSPPGGPLGEALCLGIASTTAKEAYNVPSPHCYSNSSTTSSCSKSSCEDAGHGLLHFH